MRRAPKFFSELTIEQVVRSLNTICQRWLRTRRKRSDHLPADPAAFTCAQIRYHQHRNAAAKAIRGITPQRE